VNQKTYLTAQNFKGLVIVILYFDMFSQILFYWFDFNTLSSSPTSFMSNQIVMAHTQNKIFDVLKIIFLI